MAKTTISQLAIRLNLSTEELARGLRGASVRLEGFGDRARKFNTSVGGAGAGVSRLGGSLAGLAGGLAKLAGPIGIAVAGFLSIRSAAGKVAEAFGRIDEQAKFADRIGVALDQFQVLGFAAEQSGASINTLSTSMQRATRRISEAAGGSGEAVAALAELGLNAAELARLSPDQQFKAIADAMAGVANQGDRVRLAMKLFDTEGVAMLNTLEAIAGDGLAEMNRQADELGLTLSRMDAAKVEELNDAWNSVRRALEGAWNQVAVAVAPALTALLQNVVIPMVKWVGELAKGFKTLSDWIFGTTEAATKLEKPIAEAAGAAKLAAKEMEELAKKQAAAAAARAKEVEAQRKKLLDSIKTFDREEAARLNRSFSRSVTAAPTVGAIGAGSAAAFQAMAAAANQQRAEAAEARRRRAELAASAKRREAFLKGIDDSLRRLNARPRVEVKATSIVG